MSSYIIVLLVLLSSLGFWQCACLLDVCGHSRCVLYFPVVVGSIRVLFSWLRYDCDVMKAEVGGGGIELDARCVELGLLLLDLKTRKTLSKDIVALNRRLTKQAESGESFL